MAMERFGGPDELKPMVLPVPDMAADEIIMRVETAGVGAWDPFEREGGYAQMLGIEAQFPYVLGSEGAGVVLAAGTSTKFRPGQKVYAAAFLNPKGGLYADLAVVKAACVAPIPRGLTVEQAGVMSGVGLTALRGLEDVLALQTGETLIVVGASGALGHLAVQLAKRCGARVFAVASGADGVALAKRVGADDAVDGKIGDFSARARQFAPDGFDAALLTIGGVVATEALTRVRRGGRAAWPTGLNPEPQAPVDVNLQRFDGEPDEAILARLNQRIEAGPFVVHVGHVFALRDASEAHYALQRHHLGKLALRP